MSTTYGMEDISNSLYNYNVDTIKTKAPKWTMVGRNYAPEMVVRNPGPNKYATHKVTANLRRAPEFTMGIRHSEFCSTGLPAHYQNLD